MYTKLGYIFMGIAVITAGIVLYSNSRYSKITRTFSEHTLLTSSWEKYKMEFLNQDGRILDHSQNDITTSEGQSYVLLRAVWVDDKQTFDKAWKWTKENLKRPNDNLFGWRWGKRDNGSYGFMPGGGENSASDADSDIALALILAGHRWVDSSYVDEANKILDDLWKLNTDTANGNRYLLAGNWATSPTEIVVNPSYFSPYAWRIFAQINKDHDWASLIEPAYDLIDLAGKTPLDKPAAVGLPPNWITIEKKTGQIKPTTIANFTTDYSYDAIRVPFRIALDYQWFKDERAKASLTGVCQKLEQDYRRLGKLPRGYTHDGQPLEDKESPAMYATALACFTMLNQPMAQKMYTEKIIKLYSNDTNTFNKDLPYYEQNWLWFGAAQYNNYLQPLIGKGGQP